MFGRCRKCNYCEKFDKCNRYFNGWCFSVNERSKQRVEQITIRTSYKDNNNNVGTLYRIENEEDLAMIRALDNIGWDDFDKRGPGIYFQWFDDNCAYAMPEECLRYYAPL